MAEVRQVDAFLLSRDWRDGDDGIEITLWARAKDAPVRVRLTRQEAVMFVPRTVVSHAGRRVEKSLTTMYGDPVDVLYFRSRRMLIEERERLRDVRDPVLESDVKPSDRFLMERFVTGDVAFEGPARERRGVLHFDNPRVKAASARVDVGLTHLALDIETEGFGGPLLSAAIATPRHERVIVRGSAEAPDERTLLQELFAEIMRVDPDVICGWNITEFDLTALEQRCQELRLPFAIGRAGERARVLGGSAPGRASVARVPGRVVLDGIATLKSATYSFERYTLEYVSQELLGRGKKIAKDTPSGVTKRVKTDRMAEILRMHAEEPEKLAEYNLEDCRLVLDIFREADLLRFAMERARLTGLSMDRPGGSVAAFDHLYLPRIHRRGVVAPDVGADVEIVPSPGGHVLDSVPGLYRDVLSFDFRSLYPSIIRTFAIDPLGLVQPGEDPIAGEEGATFAREGAILPELITTLHEARSSALASENAPLSRAIKILMNSFYGVLGTPGCRFFDARLPTSITRRGHAIIERARAFFEEQNLPVIYGDTDSLFVHDRSGGTEEEIANRGRMLATTVTRLFADELAAEHRVKSFLELRFESHYLRFLMPTTRGTDRGSKKRYAGMVQKAGKRELVARGLEAVRRDWTPIARRVQLELLRRVFTDEPWADWLTGIARDLENQKVPDEELVHRRRARGEDVEEYVVTTTGHEPPGSRAAPIDASHYLEKQLGPVCDVVLFFLGTSFAQVVTKQTSLF